MFREYSEIRVLNELDEGYSGARVLLIRPVTEEGQKHAPVVVKLDDRLAILYERRRYDQYVKGLLPVSAARLVDAPVVPDDSGIGGIKYTFVGGLEDTEPVSLLEVAQRRGPVATSALLRTLFDTFAPAWWLQSQPYRFGVWREYEHVLPPALVLDVVEDTPARATSQILMPLGSWSRTGQVMAGEVVALRNFVMQKTDVERDTVQLAAGNEPEAISRASKVEVRGLSALAAGNDLIRGDRMRQIVGRVVSTRDDLLRRTLRDLEPDFDLNADMLPSHVPELPDLPNPLSWVSRLLDRQISGRLSTIHGDLHLGNILVGPRGDAWLIDFARTREGHTLFDWALLEVNYLVDVVAAELPDSWENIWQVVAQIHAINQTDDPVLPDDVASDHYLVIRTIRDIVSECLSDPLRLTEYMIPLALLALRAMRWQSAGRGGRRLAFLLAALAVHTTTTRPGFTGEGNLGIETASDVDQTDVDWPD